MNFYVRHSENNNLPKKRIFYQKVVLKNVLLSKKTSVKMMYNA